jgi:nicotinate dehydrogenase subunit B
VFSNTQDVDGLAADLAQTLNLDPPNVRVMFYEGSASFGNGWLAFDLAEAASVMSRAAGTPVRLQLMRWDEQGWTNYGQGYLTDMRGGIDAHGNIVAYEATQFDQPGPGQTPTQLFLGQPLQLDLGPGDTNDENLGPMYKVSQQNYRTIAKTIPPELGIFLQGPLRAPSGPQTAFASEQFIDMLAEAAGMDPLTFRVQNIRTDGDFPRWTAALQAAANASPYKPHVPASQVGSGPLVTGWGMAIGSHHEPWAATVAHVQVNMKTGKVSVLELWSGQDSGLIVNPGLVENQMSGCLIQGTSIALCEELRFSKERVSSTDWVTYPILRFKDAPKVNTIVVQRLDKPSVGSGEPPLVSVAASVANAFYDATGVRVLRLPMTPDRVRATLQAAGKA